MKQILQLSQRFMEKKEQQCALPSSAAASFMDYYNNLPSSTTVGGLLDYSSIEVEKDSLGFMELLGMQADDHFGLTTNMFHDVLPSTVGLPTTTMVHNHHQEYSSDVLNAPATPNSSSISSESVGGLINDSSHNNKKDTPLDDAHDEEEEQVDHQKTKKELKAKKTSQKRQREPRFAFMTKSEIDHLEDGYRWRKYGQKAVKNSPFPRSYYRCTTASCSVKKRVERSFSDPAIVVTTYEGQHTHPSPTMPRSAAPFSGFSYVGAPPFADQMILSSHQQLTHLNNFSTNHVINSPVVGREPRFSSHNSAVLTDNGLLQDIVPNWSFVKKEGM